MSVSVSVPDCPHCKSQGKSQEWKKPVLDFSVRKGELRHIYCKECGSTGSLMSAPKKPRMFRHLFVMNEVAGKGVRWEREGELMVLLLAKEEHDYRAYLGQHPELLLFISITTDEIPAWEEVAPPFDPDDQTPIHQDFPVLVPGNYTREEAC